MCKKIAPRGLGRYSKRPKEGGRKSQRRYYSKYGHRK